MLTMKVDESTPSEDKSPSPELFSLIKAAASNLMSFGELWKSIKKKGRDEGFNERELQDILRPLLKPQLNKDQIYYLFHTDEKKEQSKQTYNKLTDNRNIPTVPLKKEPEERPSPPKDPDPEEEPTPLELAEIEIAQLKDALKKTEQFKPATQLEQREEPQPRQMTIDECFDFLPDDSAMTCWKINRIAGNALKNRISAWQGNTTKIFRVWMQEV